MTTSVMLPEVVENYPLAYEALAPEALANVLELLLDLARRSPFGHAHEIADPNVGRDFDEHMDMIPRQRPADDGYALQAVSLSEDTVY